MPSEIVLDRRTRKRDQRRESLLDLAAELIERDGIDGFTMTSLAEAADYAPASLYTYVASRSALFTQLQVRALATLTDVALQQAARWDEMLSASGALDPGVDDLARLLAYADLFLTAPQHHPREFKLQQQLLNATGAVDADDAASVVPAAMQALGLPRSLFEHAIASGALSDARDDDAITVRFGTAMTRTFAYVIAMNGALTVDSLIEGSPGSGLEIGRSLARTLLTGWGASPEHVTAASTLAAGICGFDHTTTDGGTSP